jgi:hypothetical protein
MSAILSLPLPLFAQPQPNRISPTLAISLGQPWFFLSFHLLLEIIQFVFSGLKDSILSSSSCHDETSILLFTCSSPPTIRTMGVSSTSCSVYLLLGVNVREAVWSSFGLGALSSENTSHSCYRGVRQRHTNEDIQKH